MKRQKNLSVGLVFIFLFASLGNTFAADDPFDNKIRAALDYIEGIIPYTGPPVTYTGPPITIRFSTFMAQSMAPFMDAFLPCIKMLEKESKGKLIIKPYYSNVLHGPQDGFKACINDITDFTHGYSLWQPQSFNLPHGISLPFSFPDSAVASIVAEELVPKYFKREFEKMGVYLAGGHGNPPYNLLSKKPIRKLEDLKGLKIRSGGGVMAETVKRLGAVPVMVPASEFYTAFQRGVFDAQLSHDGGFVVFRTYEIGKYRTVIKLSSPANEYILNKKTFDKLPPDLKIIFSNWLQKFNQIEPQIYFEREAYRSINKMKNARIEMITLPPAEIEKWKAATLPVLDKFISENESKGFPAKQFVKDMRALTEKYSAMSWNDLMMHKINNPVKGIIDF